MLYANGVFADMLKRRMETVIGAKFSNFVSPAHRGRLTSFLKDPANRPDEMALVTESGEEVFVQLSGSIQAIGGLPRTCLVATDISRRVSAENALRKARDELEEKVAQRTAELLWTNDVLRGRSKSASGRRRRCAAHAASLSSAFGRGRKSFSDRQVCSILRIMPFWSGTWRIG